MPEKKDFVFLNKVDVLKKKKLNPSCRLVKTRLIIENVMLNYTEHAREKRHIFLFFIKTNIQSSPLSF
jgi:hypothetical protein